MDSKIADLRRNYTKGGLQEEQLPENPILFFKQWFDEALKSEVMEPNAMSLATVTSDGRPNSRMVLLKGIEETSIEFYTNYSSDKGHELEETPFVAVTFWWPNWNGKFAFGEPRQNCLKKRVKPTFNPGQERANWEHGHQIKAVRLIVVNHLKSSSKKFRKSSKEKRFRNRNIGAGTK